MPSPITVLRRLVFLCAVVVSPALAAAADGGRIRVTSAEFQAEGPAMPQPVTLPDTWALRGLPAAGTGQYRLRFTLPARVNEVWALDAERLSSSHELRLNGQLVHGAMQEPPPLKRAMHSLITLPPHLLRAGENTLDIRVSSGASGGLSALWLGPADVLDAEFRRSQLREVGLPQIANVAAGGVSLFMMLLWWRRRSEVAIGSFGALCLLASLRNYGYFATAAPLPAAFSSWLYMLAALLTTVLLGVFAMAFAETRPAWFRRLLWVTGTGFAVLTLLAMTFEVLQLARQWLYPVLLLLVLPSLALLLRAAWHKRSSMDITLVASLAGVLLAGGHDYLFQQGRLSIMGHFWLPYAVPAVVAVYAALLLKRLLMNMDAVERMNATLERKVIERTQELQAANAAKTRFLAAASHDLRQPMVSIGLLAGLMKEQVGQGPLRRVVQRLQDATGAMESLLTRLLDLSRLQSGTVRVQRQPLRLQALFEGAAAQHREQAHRLGLQLRVRPSAGVVDSDPTLLQQIVGNLLGNAVRYTERGGVLLAARAAGPRHWRLEVWDTGVGIPAAQHQAVFAEFVRGAGPVPAGEAATGLGLGLAIAQGSAALLGAKVVLRSRPGRGSCFSVLLPRAAEAAPHSAPALALASENRPLAACLLWLLEDDPHARESLQMLLLHWGAQVRAFSQVGELQAAVDEAGDTAARPDLLVTDLRLPDARGTAALAHLRRHWPGLPAVIVTGNTSPVDLVELALWRESGVPVLVKPFAGAALRAAVLAVLMRQTSQQPAAPPPTA